MSDRMPGFSPPALRVRLSFLAAMEEFRAEGRGAAAGVTMLGREIRLVRGVLARPGPGSELRFWLPTG